jgi:hypothetical protein
VCVELRSRTDVPRDPHSGVAGVRAACAEVASHASKLIIFEDCKNQRVTTPAIWVPAMTSVSAGLTAPPCEFRSSELAI